MTPEGVEELGILAVHVNPALGGVAAVFPGTIIGVLLVQMISTGLVYLQVDLYLQDMVAASVIFFAVFVDAQRMRLLTRLERRNIRVEKGESDPPAARPAPAPS